MATIRVKRSTLTSAPTGLTFGEPAFVDGINSFYVTKNDGTSLRVGAEVDSSTSLGTSNNKIPTQGAVKSYVDSQVAGGAVSTIEGLTGAIDLVAGTGIQITTAGQNVTFTNVGVRSVVAGTNISVSGATGDNVSIGVVGSPTFTNLTVSGNLTVNGDTTTVNSNTLTVDDPIITLGLSGGVPITASDGGKDRGLAFTYFDSTGKTGFFGWDASGSRFVFGGVASVASEVVSVTTFSPVQASNVILTETVGQNTVTIAPTLAASNTPTYTLPDYASGTFLIPTNEGTANYIIKSNGSGSQPTWINANATGFTAFTSTNVLTASDTSDTSAYLAFVNDASATNQGVKYNAGLTYNAVTNSLSATTFVGALSGNASTATTLQTSRNIGLTGDISGSASFNGSADINITATIAANSVALGTDTTGNYVATLSTSSTGLSIANSGAESAAVTVNFATITSGLNMGTFSFATGEFTNSSGTVSLGTIDGGTFT